MLDIASLHFGTSRYQWEMDICAGTVSFHFCTYEIWGNRNPCSRYWNGMGQFGSYRMILRWLILRMDSTELPKLGTESQIVAGVDINFAYQNLVAVLVPLGCG